MNDINEPNINHIKGKLKAALFVIPPLILLTWLHENNYFGVFG